MSKEDKYHKALIDIIDYCEAHKDAMEDSFSFETLCEISDAARVALSLPRHYGVGGAVNASIINDWLKAKGIF